ncbi:hypothetical protein S40288_07678 [Stachybotrys chartarum IBT 40288]|nr:hypothetical protein S40288_07678 [Stachybotrys chartarum IBT 40288]
MFSPSFLKATTSLALVLLCAPVSASTAATSRAVHNATANLPFRNPMLCIESRVDDLLSRMTIEEKAGQLFHTILFSGPNGTFASATAGLNSTDFVIGTHRPVGLEEYESVGFSFNKPVVTGLLKETLGFKAIYVEGFDEALLADRGFTVVATPEEADLAILRLRAPVSPSNSIEEGTDLQSGSLEYTAEEKERQAKIYDQVPTIVDINFNRPAAVPEVAEKAVALFATYDSSTQALLNVVFNTDGAEPLGNLPFDLPRSDAAVETSSEDQPFDTPDPVFRFDHGLRYKPLPCRGCSSVL